MSASVTSVVAKAGKSYGVNDSGACDIVEKYQVVLSEPLASGELLTTFSDGTHSVPAIGSVHPDRPGYYAAKYEISQPEGHAKSTLDITVKYEPQSWITEGSGENPPLTNVEQWGWDSATASRELVTDVDGAAVLNSAGDPFESTVNIESPAPVFTKVVRFNARQSNWFDYNCKVNAAAVTIGGITFAARTLLCNINEVKDIGAEKYPFKYTIRLRYRTNLAKIAQGSSATECGWDAVICDAGMRSLDSSTGKKKLIQVISEETGQPANVTKAELLNGSGQPLARTPNTAVEPYNIRFKAYAETTFPDWFTSEPPTPTRPSNSNS